MFQNERAAVPQVRFEPSWSPSGRRSAPEAIFPNESDSQANLLAIKFPLADFQPTMEGEKKVSVALVLQIPHNAYSTH